jgi:membrane-bound ClpP family serine protease
VPDDTGVIVGIFLAIIVVSVLLIRMTVVIQPGQIGLVFLMGRYRWGLLPGLNFVHPYAQVVKLTPGSGPNGILGLLGRAETDLAPDLPPGNVSIGESHFTARGATRIPAGTTVRVIKDVNPGPPVVAEELGRQGGPKIPNLPAASGPLK